MPNDDKTLGTGWQVLFKINMIILPFVVAWAVWATGSIYELRGFANQGPRFTAKDGENITLEMKEWARENFVGKTVEADIKEIKNDVQAIKVLIATLPRSDQGERQ